METFEFSSISKKTSLVLLKVEYTWNLLTALKRIAIECGALYKRTFINVF